MLTSSQGADSLQRRKLNVSRLVIKNLRLGTLGPLAAVIDTLLMESERAGDARYSALLIGTAHWPGTV